jgi:hypothetical protein
MARPANVTSAATEFRSADAKRTGRECIECRRGPLLKESCGLHSGFREKSVAQD